MEKSKQKEPVQEPSYKSRMESVRKSREDKARQMSMSVPIETEELSVHLTKGGNKMIESGRSVTVEDFNSLE